MSIPSWMIRPRKQLLIIICILAFARIAAAQDSTSHRADDATASSGRSGDVGTTELGIWTGYSGYNPTLIGRTTNRSLFELNLQYARVLKTSDNWGLKYTAELVPVAYVRQPEQVVINDHPEDLPGGKQTIYGIGISPVGFQLNFRRGKVLQPYLNGTAGIFYFRDQVPVAHSSKFNFGSALGLGIQIWYCENQSIRVGYKYNHISNGYTASNNPGMDSNLFYVGYSWSWPH